MFVFFDFVRRRHNLPDFSQEPFDFVTSLTFLNYSNFFQNSLFGCQERKYAIKTKNKILIWTNTTIASLTLSSYIGGRAIIKAAFGEAFRRIQRNTNSLALAQADKALTPPIPIPKPITQQQ